MIDKRVVSFKPSTNFVLRRQFETIISHKTRCFESSTSFQTKFFNLNTLSKSDNYQSVIMITL